ncbi:hypothetical protein IMCC21906_02129 [Spongiibacter sp. IMCC21906]|jgi:uncharacterized protein (DUF934 family)|uniref:DUF934 domain-containing protein n=1 Tax=Spongiibacter sp. IMCC21906 TaxID=1620392 RepID=UPI00062DF36F|nr:DUF934 domain-containing protein [Spongiibacter sp. IMCC21906]AKH69797.1 hypothetical protein IMCC21906_02129 [Spongiibacter sp. IMCC21906]
MPKIIKNNQLVDDNWLLWRDTESLPEQGPVIVPLKLWQEHKASLKKLDNVAVFLSSDESPKLLADDLDNFDMIAVDFPKFADGRGFSYGRELREQHGFTGELRAIGDFIRDQLFFLKRCGFDAYALDTDDLEGALASFNDFSTGYQASVDQPLPLYRRR